jgi:dTDP-4-dehydrorhamnose reductase
VAWSGSTRGARFGFELRCVDLKDEPSVHASLAHDDPDLVIHTAAISSADAVYRDPRAGWSVNVRGTEILADWASRLGRRLLFTSTDLVYSGSGSWYREQDPADPVLEYGKTKRAAEPFVLAVPGGLVARVSLLYGPSCTGKPGTFDRAMDALRAGIPQAFFCDEFRTPLDYVTAAEILIRLAESDLNGLIHVGGAIRLSRFQLMRKAALAQGIDPDLVRSNLRVHVRFPEPRPADVSLATLRLQESIPDVIPPNVGVALTRRAPS